MPTVVIAPDSFKGSLSAAEVGACVKQGIARVRPDLRVLVFPMADGGEGTIDAVLAFRPAERHRRIVHDAAGAPRGALFVSFDADGMNTALLEVAQVVPLPDAPGSVETRTSFGVGEQLRLALDLGVRRVLIGLGGSSTNDGGAGALAALGARLFDRDRRLIARPALQDLEHLAGVDLVDVDQRLATIDLVLLSDVDSPLCGAQGATRIFGPQKGVRPGDLERYDGWIARYAALADAAAGAPISQHPGAGAAGGIGYAMQLLGARNRSGAETVAEINGLSGALAGADWVITGEGRSDPQTLHGKVPIAVARLARRAGVAVTLLSGGIAREASAQLAPHFDGCFSIVNRPMPLETAIADAAGLIVDAAEQLTRLRFGGAG